MRVSTNSQRMAGLSFDSQYSAMQFYQSSNTSSSNSQLQVKLREKSTRSATSAVRSRRHSFSGSAKHRANLKSQISNPCCFAHITALKPTDLINGQSMSELNNNSNKLNNNIEYDKGTYANGTLGAPHHMTASCVQLPADGMISPSRSV